MQRLFFLKILKSRKAFTIQKLIPQLVCRIKTDHVILIPHLQNPTITKFLIDICDSHFIMKFFICKS